jgi:hypothetical protein
VINVGITFAALAGFEVLRTRFHRRSLIRRLLKRHLALLEFYRTTPPSPFIYYLTFPVLAPILYVVSPKARREIKLYRRFVFANFVVLALLKVREHQTLWAPELSFADFARSTAVVLLFQLAFVLVLVVPVIVTVVDYRARKQDKRLTVLAILFAGTSSLAAAGYLAQPEGKLVPLPVCARMRQRTEAAPERAEAARDAALEVAAAHADEGKRAKRRRGGEELLGRPLELAREELKRFYKDDEATCFRLFSIEDKAGEPVLLLQGDVKRRKLAPVWAARRAGKTTERIVDDADLGGAEALKEIAR